MSRASQKRAVANNRRRLSERGMSRYEVRGLDADKQLVRALAKRLAVRDSAAERLRAEVEQKIAEGSPSRGRIFEALRRSPLVGADIDMERDDDPGRDIDL